MLTIAGGIILAIGLILIGLVVLAFLPEIMRGIGALILVAFGILYFLFS